MEHVHSTLGAVPEPEESWFLVIDHKRIPTTKTPIEEGAEQLRVVLDRVKQRSILVADSEYGNATFPRLARDVPCDKLLRLRSNRVLYGPPPPYGSRGRPRIHSHRFALKEPETW